jgi:ribosome-associated protein YbcJ (S4-like RNA binding protein)
VDTRRGRKLVNGDVVSYNGQEVLVVKWLLNPLS